MSDRRSKLRQKPAQVSPADVYTSSLSAAETSRIQTPVQVSPDAHQTLLPIPETSVSNNTHAGSTRMDGVGNLLYHLHSAHFTCFCLTRVMTSLQFYEHVVVATTTRRLWCFPGKARVYVIPRFKIVDVSSSIGPRRIPIVVYLFVAVGLFMTIMGALMGGCSSCGETQSSSGYNDYSYGYSDYSYGYSSYSSSSCTATGGTCAYLIIGIILLAIPVPLFLLLPCICKWHHVYLDVKTPTPNKRFISSSGIETHTFRFKKIGFDHATDDKATFDEFYLFEYVYGSFQKGGTDMMSEAHLLSHFNNVSLATPIVPFHANNTIRDICHPIMGVNRRKKHSKHGKCSGEDTYNGSVEIQV